jgi:hypothetical protein
MKDPADARHGMLLHEIVEFCPVKPRNIDPTALRTGAAAHGGGALESNARMLPVSTPPNAIVYGSGLVPLREMIRAGAVLDVVGIVLSGWRSGCCVRSSV